MFEDFKQFVPSRVCLSCDGCCRFKEQDSRWRPYITPGEQKAAAKPAPAEKIFRAGVVSPDGRITATPCASGFICHFFNAADNTCGIYHARPFECRLYPFLPGLKDGQRRLYGHLNCPHVQQHWGSTAYREYTEYLKEFLRRKDVGEFLKQNPGLFSDYSAYAGELDDLGPLAAE